MQVIYEMLLQKEYLNIKFLLMIYLKNMFFTNIIISGFKTTLRFHKKTLPL